MEALINVLATYRLTRLAVEDTITEDLRHKVWEHFPVESKFGYLWTCPHCASVWLAAGVLAARTVAPRASAPVLNALAVAGAVSLISDIRAYADVVG